MDQDQTPILSPENPEEPVEEIAAPESVKAPERKLQFTFNRPLAVDMVCGGVFAFTAALLVYYIFFASTGVISADAVDSLMWGNASYEAGGLLNQNFNYACLLPFGGNLIMWPMVAIFGLSLTAQHVGMFLFTALLFGSLFLMLRFAGWKWRWNLLCVSAVILTLCGSAKLREIFFEHIIYYSLGAFFSMVLLAVAFKVFTLLERQKPLSRLIPLYVAAFLWCLLTATNQLTALTLFHIPVLGAFVLERFLHFKTGLPKREKNGGLLLLAAAVLGTGAGYFLGDILKTGLTAGYESAYSSLSPPGDWYTNFTSVFTNWPTLLGVGTKDWVKIMSGDGIVMLLTAVFCLLLVLLPAAALLRYRQMDRASRVLILFHWLTAAFVMMGVTFGKLSGADWRLSPIVFTSVLASFVLLRHVWRTKKRRLAALAAVPMAAVMILNFFQVAQMAPAPDPNAPLFRTARLLEEQNLTYGYATFWNANVVTVISASKVKVRNVTIDDYGIRPYDYQTEDRWYQDRPGQDKYFLLMDAGEYGMMEKSDPDLLKSAAVEPLGGYTLAVFDHNIF